MKLEQLKCFKKRLLEIKKELNNCTIERKKELFKEQFSIYINIEVIPTANEMIDYNASFDNETDLLSLVSNRIFINKYGMQGIN